MTHSFKDDKNDVRNRNDHCASKAYLSRPPEGLTVRGYRTWATDYMATNRRVVGSGDIRVGPAHDRDGVCLALFTRHLGERSGQLAFSALGTLVHNLGICATCPLKTYAPNSHHLGSDECLLLGLIAAIQYGDEDAMYVSINALSCIHKCDLIIGSAAEYAAIMKGEGSILLPIPADVINDIYVRSRQSTALKNTTLH